eukprot:Amastigsp_a682522_4.p4 type:complete len:115 gc:universal Amastigsp_a682522_4:334-678(+)
MLAPHGAMHRIFGRRLAATKSRVVTAQKRNMAVRDDGTRRTRRSGRPGGHDVRQFDSVRRHKAFLVTKPSRPPQPILLQDLHAVAFLERQLILFCRKGRMRGNSKHWCGVRRHG